MWAGTACCPDLWDWPQSLCHQKAQRAAVKAAPMPFLCARTKGWAQHPALHHLDG